MRDTLTYIGITLLAWALAFGVCFAAEPDPNGYWAWVDARGVYCFTNDPDEIPAAYREEATRHTWAELAERTAERRSKTP